MIGLIILFLLAIWCLLTVLAMWVGYKIGKRNHFPKTGIFTGFMLVMGGWFVYWAIEFSYIQMRIKELCEKEAGLTVYVTPEEWRKQIGEEEWSTLKSDYKGIAGKSNFKFNGKNYHSSSQLHRRLFSFTADDRSNERFTSYDIIYVDIYTNQVLLRKRSFGVSARNILGLKFWLGSIDDCSMSDWPENDRFFQRNYVNH